MAKRRGRRRKGGGGGGGDLESGCGDPSDDALVGPDEDVAAVGVVVGLTAALLQLTPVVVEPLEQQRAVLQRRPVEGVDHLELAAQLALRQVVQHPRVHQRLHERRPAPTSASASSVKPKTKPKHRATHSIHDPSRSRLAQTAS